MQNVQSGAVEVSREGLGAYLGRGPESRGGRRRIGGPTPDGTTEERTGRRRGGRRPTGGKGPRERQERSAAGASPSARLGKGIDSIGNRGTETRCSGARLVARQTRHPSGTVRGCRGAFGLMSQLQSTRFIL